MHESVQRQWWKANRPLGLRLIGAVGVASWGCAVVVGGCSVYEQDLLSTGDSSREQVTDGDAEIADSPAGLVDAGRVPGGSDGSSGVADAGPTDGARDASQRVDGSRDANQPADASQDASQPADAWAVDGQWDAALDAEGDGSPVCPDVCTDLPNVSASSCATGACVIDQCQDGYADCDGETANGCEHDTVLNGSCLPEESCARDVYLDNEYFFCADEMAWPAARNRCRSVPGGDLVRIADADENDFVQAHISSASWLGGSDAQIERLWLWTDNSMPFWRGLEAGATVLSQYARWGAGQPDDAGADEDCAQMSVDGTWTDEDCGAAREFVCEVSADLCPEDADKRDPGQCGCGVPDTDADGDGFASCNDTCPDDPDKTEPGGCGCGVADTNTDGDSEPDCNDECDTDPDKISPGVCGCGVADTNTDGDSEPDCNDECDTDPDKVTPGACGCGVAEVAGDSDGDGVLDCVDGCPQNALSADAASGCGLGFVPANIDVTLLAPQQADATTTFNCSAVLNTSGTPTFTSWCSGSRPQITIQPQVDGPELVVVALRGLNVPSGGSLDIEGSRPAVLVVFGDATVAGTIDASASGVTPQAGGNVDCGASAGGDVTTCGSSADETGGGGGGGFGTAGGHGGDGDDCNGRPGGEARGTASLVPLLGGCPGGAAGRCSGRGAGGGALQLSVGGTLTVSGRLRANGGDGPDSCNYAYYGGGGGGSGGAIRVEAGSLVTTGATIEAKGGDGGDSSYSGGPGSTSSSAPGGDATNPSNPPEWFGGGGGGGGYGRIVLCNRGTNEGCP